MRAKMNAALRATGVVGAETGVAVSVMKQNGTGRDPIAMTVLGAE